jgi:hypothetical protein
MRFIAYLLIFVGLIYLADATYDQYRGIASVRSPSRAATRNIASRAEKPKEFRNLMAYQWTRGSLILLAGIIILEICRHSDRHDPLSPDFGRSDSSDEG